MDIINISSRQYELTQSTLSTSDGKTKAELSTIATSSLDISATFEASPEADEAVTYTADMEKVKAMKEETDQRMIDLFKATVKGGALKQLGGIRGFLDRIKNNEMTNLKDKIEVQVSQAEIDQAIEETSEDGYWGAEATSERFLDFAKALSGDNPEKADLLIDAFKEGYKAAEEMWGESLPQLSQDTYDLTLEKFEAWKNGDPIETTPELDA